MASTLTVDNIVGATSASTVHAPGHVIQVVNGTGASNINITTSSRVDVISLSITPKFATSKILVSICLADVGKGTSGNTYGRFWLMRNTGDLIRIAGQVGYTNTTNNNSVGSLSTSYLDSPSTTSSTTYKVQGANMQSSGTVEVGSSTSISTITLLEIAQ
jgi:hypothetical protein